MTKFSHIDDKGNVKMVDVTNKLLTVRVAKAKGKINMPVSRYRNCFCKETKKDEWVSNFKMTTAAGDHQFIKANSKYMAIATRGGGGPVLIWEHEKRGRVPRDAAEVRLLYALSVVRLLPLCVSEYLGSFWFVSCSIMDAALPLVRRPAPASSRAFSSSSTRQVRVAEDGRETTRRHR